MRGRIVPFPGRPRVRIGAETYEVVAPADLPRVLGALRRQLYRRAKIPAGAAPRRRDSRTVRDRDRCFALLVAAAAVNALLED